MRLCGIIAEYNPLHNGHLLHMAQSMQITRAEGLVICMGGNFTQRGEAAILSKWMRAHMALAAGADLVVELPFVYAAAPAQRFALGGIRMLAGLGVTDFAFGCEAGALEPLVALAGFLAQETPAYRELLRSYLKQGYALPKARELALGDCPGAPLTPQERRRMVAAPNNGLALEYLIANASLGHPMRPHAILRQGAEHLDTALTGPIASATALRRAIREGGITPEVEAAMPPLPPGALPLPPGRLEPLLLWTLRSSSRRQVEGWFDLPADLAGALFKHRDKPGVETILKAATSRAVTLSRLRRAWLHGLMGVTQARVEQVRREGEPLYARILGLRGNSAVPGFVKKNASLPLIAKAADFYPSEGAQSILWQADARASELYSLLEGNQEGGRDIRTAPIVY